MKKLYVIFLAAIVAACGSDDGDTDPFSDVPSGEIVSVDERDFVLTGEDASGRTAQTYKWWKQNVSKIDFSSEECGDDEDLSQTDVYYAFTSSGNIRVRQGASGDGYIARTWAWSSSAKNAINIDGETSVDFELRALNNTELIYASYQSAQGCSLVTWERFVQ
ncbi:hypothetical protein [Ekhidna sp.]|uniref:hypothetical protein n=1 Tax=Ekhidna sp. TaxID=2608089 RepID=UPI003C7B68E8